MLKKVGLWTGVTIMLMTLLVPAPAGLTPAAWHAVGVTLLMAVWWMTEAISIFMTALVPLALFPLLGILSASATAENYGHNYVLMLLGGFFLARAIEYQGLHRRIALYIIRLIGTSRRKLLLSFMVATAFLSLWIANVAVVLMLLPIAMALIVKDESAGSGSRFGLAMMLSIAYAASIGGTGSLIGTPPNMVLAGLLNELYPEAPEISFFTWLKAGLPVVILGLPLLWLFMINYFGISGRFDESDEIIEDQWNALGRISKGERRVFILFTLTALGWIFRRSIDFGWFVIPGWSDLLGITNMVHDSTVAIAGALLLFMVSDGGGQRLLTWKEASQVPWGVVLIVGGGYALAAAFGDTGLAVWIGGHLRFIGSLPPWMILLAVVTIMVFLTEVNSNTATANIFLPVWASMALAGQVNPLILMIPATIACSFAFMLPSGTGTNAVVFASGRVRIPEMARCGFQLNLISILFLTLVLYFIIVPLLGLDVSLPAWAQ
ncbi:MAG TPA: SLC13 family permease [Saprospiraceae bacterium]|nr:SLC13/DASS family transporter [Saprospiraceae bacterium]MCB9269590.1 SLC13/DASS family transporter [Lewinellaceae bacterium]HPG06098.1 SLC13 family permease [Saprospiraceae bacterium]HRV84081.1 SLC13 family permease [Saprospiraceae bacterium]